MKELDHETLVHAMWQLAHTIESCDGVANAVIAAAAERLARYHQRITDLEQQIAEGN